MERSFIEQAVRGGLLASILVALGCSGHVNIGDDSDGLSAESGSGGFGSTGGSGPLANDAGGSASKCSEPPGPDLIYSFPTAGQATFATPTDFYSAIAGRWLICGGRPFDAVPADVIGLEYGSVTWENTHGRADDPQPAGNRAIPDVPTGTLYLLVAGPDGLTRGTGADYELTYFLMPRDNPEDPPFPTALEMVRSDLGLVSTATYSESPPQWLIGNANSTLHPRWRLAPAD